MNVELRPITIETDSADEVGRLALIDGRLVALLVQLEASHGPYAGQWSLEWFGGRAGLSAPLFADLDSAVLWIADRIALA